MQDKDTAGSLIERIKDLEKKLAREFQRNEVEFFYQVRKKKVHFSAATKARNRTFAKRLHRYLLDSKLRVIITGPLIWAGLLPIALLDLFASVYEAICFRIYGIPRVRRGDYVVMDRHRLGYLNLIEKLNCVYCGYANGVLAWFTEIAARTEQYFCPIKHALRMSAIHGRYRHFLEYGDAEGYRERIEEIRRSFHDIAEAEAEAETASGPVKEADVE